MSISLKVEPVCITVTWKVPVGEGTYPRDRLLLREVLTKRRNVLRSIKGKSLGGEGGLRETTKGDREISRQDLDATRYLVLRRISVRKIVQRQSGISTTGHVIEEHDGTT